MDCTVTVCDTHPEERFALSRSVLDNADRVYRWSHNTGPYSRFVPLAAYDHEYTFFVDDDMVPGSRCVEHFVAAAQSLPGFGSIGQLGRVIPPNGVYAPRGVPRLPRPREVDVLVRGFFVRTRNLHHIAQLRWLMNYVDEQVPEDDMLLCVAMRLCAGLRNYLTPTDPDPETLMNRTELPDPHALHRRPDHLERRVMFMKTARDIGWQPMGQAPAALAKPARPVQPALPVRAAQVARPRRPDLGLPAREPATRGVLYLAVGDSYAELATASARTLRLHGYDGPVRVVTDAPRRALTELECETHVIGSLPGGFASRFHKTQLYRWSFDHTLFLDADTIVVSSIEQIWENLRGHDLAMAPDLHSSVAQVIANSVNDPARRAPEYQLMRELGLTERRYYNSGVLLFRRNRRTADLFARWHEEWNRFGGEDQLALIRAIASSGAKVRTLDSSWNRRPKAFASADEARAAGVRILHFLSRQRPFLNDTYLGEVAEYLG
jgi:Glycosyl transferase family 8